MKSINKGMNVILMMSVLYCSVGLGFAQTGIGTRNPQGALHIDGAKDNDVTAPALPTISQAANDVVIDAATGYLGVGVLTPKVPLDMRSSINSENALGLGTTTMTAAAAAAGAVRYDEVNAPVGAKIEYSDGSVWNKLYVAPKKVVVVARQNLGQNIGTSAADIINWTLDPQANNIGFTPATGVFTAPRDGKYTFLFTFNLAATMIDDGTRVESQFYRTSGTPAVLARVYKTFGHSMNNETEDGPAGFRMKDTQAGGSSTATFSLTQGTTVTVRMLHNLTGGNIPLRVPNNSLPDNPDAGFNSLTIIEH